MDNHCQLCKQADGYKYPRLKNTASISHSDHPLSCPDCDRLIVLVNIDTAAAVTGKSRKTIYDWIKQDRVKAVRTAGGHWSIWYSTLFPSTDRK